MAKLTLNNITSGFESHTAHNANNDLIEQALEKTLSRDGTSPNQMQANFDMNGFMILNQANPIAISGFTWEGPWLTAQSYSVGDIVEDNGTAYICIVAHTSGVFATDLTAAKWQVLATAGLPAQTGHANKFLQTDGAASSWQVPDATEVTYSSTVAQTVAAKLTPLVTPEDFGAIGNGVANDVAAIQAAIDSLTSGGIVYFGSKTYLVGTTITLKSNVRLIGHGSGATKIKLANAANVPVIQTVDFATLTGSNKWLLSENVPYGFGIDAMTIDGNRTNQTAGNGVNIYGKGYYIGFDLKVVNAKEIGFYSECSYKGGQAVEQDMPEGHIGKVQVYMSGKEGFVYRGPHDQPIHDVSVSQAGQDGVYDGVVFEGKNNIYNGATYVTGSIHSYACTGRGVTFRTHTLANLITGENNDRDGVVFEATGETAGMIGGVNAHVNMVEAYGNDNNNTGLYWGLRSSGASNVILGARISTSGQAAGGIYVNGNFNRIGAGTVTASNAVVDGIGVKLDGNYLDINVVIQSFDSGASVGLQTETIGYSKINCTIYGCVTSWLHNVSSVDSSYNIQAFHSAGTFLSKVGTFAATDSFNINASQGGAQLSSYGLGNSAIASGNTSVTLTHNGFITPTATDFSITPTNDWSFSYDPDGAGADTATVVMRAMWIANITATTFDVVTNVAAPVGGLTFGWKLDI